MARHTLVVIGSTDRITLLVIPHDTPGGAARALLRSAARPGSTDTAEEILTGGGGKRELRAENARQRWEANGGSIGAE